VPILGVYKKLNFINPALTLTHHFQFEA
jgi:hypothetical protein